MVECEWGVSWDFLFVVVFDVFVLFGRDGIGCFVTYGDVVVVQCVRDVFGFSESAVLVAESGW